MQDLRQKLIDNRSRRQKGFGKAYWDSVIEVIEEHYAQKKQGPRVVGNEIIRGDRVLDCRTPEDGFKDDLEIVLDEHFPKGQCKHRGVALVFFAYANILFAKHLKRALKRHE